MEHRAVIARRLDQLSPSISKREARHLTRAAIFEIHFGVAEFIKLIFRSSEVYYLAPILRVAVRCFNSRNGRTRASHPAQQSCQASETRRVNTTGGDKWL